MKLSIQARRMLQVIAIANLLAAVALSLYYYRSGNVFSHLSGLLLGGASSVVKVILLEKTVNRLVHKRGARGTAQLSYLLQLVLTFFTLLVGAMVENMSLLGVVIGILSYQLGTYFLGSTLRDSRNREKE